MNSGWLQDLSAVLNENNGAVRVSVIKAEGSAPCRVGSAMTITESGFSGTIGGGALEMAALEAARKNLCDASETLEEHWQRKERDFPLGPALGQCCGGRVRLLFERLTVAEAGAISVMVKTQSEQDILLRPLSGGHPMEQSGERTVISSEWPSSVQTVVQEIHAGTRPRTAMLVDDWFVEPLGQCHEVLFLYGAGHVGRAVVHAFNGLPFEIFWVDTVSERYPQSIPKDVNQLISKNPADAVQYAPSGSWHVVMTFSHAIDFEVCQAVLERGDFAYAGVIASKTKRTRFLRKLHKAGFPEALVSRLHAPIGLGQLDGKEPAEIAISLAADLLLRLKDTAVVEGLKTRSAIA